MPRVTTEALVLRRTPFGESSEVVDLFTRDRGRLALMAKGVHRPRSRKGGGADLMDLCLVTYTQRKGSRSLPQLVERQVIAHHRGLRSRDDLLGAGFLALELLRALVPEGQPQRGLYELSVAYLEALDARPSREGLVPTVFALLGGMLRLTGFEPVLDRCVGCDRRPEVHHLLRCDPARGGVVCAACRRGDDHSFPLSGRAARVIGGLSGADPRRVADVSIPHALESQVRRFFDRVYVHVLERPLRCSLLP